MTIPAFFRAVSRSTGFLLAILLLVPAFAAPQARPQRPRITGIANVGYFVSNLPAALVFWHDFLGFDESYQVNKPGTHEARIVFLKINGHQHVELFNEPPTHPPSRMSHICFTVENVAQMRAYLRSQGIEVKTVTSEAHTGDSTIQIEDPDGAIVEFEQPLPTGLEARTAGKFDPPTRIATQIYHVGFTAGNSRKSLEFYGKILGFQETWRGAANPAELSWINMRVPDGADYVEFMLYRTLDPKTLGTRNHLSLAVPDIARAVATLEARPAYKSYGKPLSIHLGVNRKHQVNLFDPDGTRVELMEPFTIDGKVTPSSTAPPPPPAHN